MAEEGLTSPQIWLYSYLAALQFRRIAIEIVYSEEWVGGPPRRAGRRKKKREGRETSFGKHLYEEEGRNSKREVREKEREREGGGKKERKRGVGEKERQRKT